MEVKQSLLSAVDEVLDKMAFMFFDEAEEPPPEDIAFQYVTEVNTDGCIVGKLNILVTEEGARNIARNLIGIRDEDELYDGTLQDALREFTNLVMGRTMTLLNPDGSFDMEVPRLVPRPADAQDGLTHLVIDGTLDDEPFRLRLQYEPL